LPPSFGQIYEKKEKYGLGADVSVCLRQILEEKEKKKEFGPSSIFGQR